ncbi:Kiwa anti-phage protein KwaB-like domain-containing protein [Sporomusa paucivorans]|uniref:Kiwa anti-phage protein KwaB-like domain-containing protein n=1 Tax=Sporomusa paucivorans TaxID=2376 RepID=UPI0035716D89
MPNINEVITAISMIKNNLTRINLYFLEKRSSGGQPIFKSYTPLINTTLNAELGNACLDYLSTVLTGKEIVDFDPLCYAEDTVETIDSAEIPCLAPMLEAMQAGSTQMLNFDQVSPSKTIGYCLTMTGENGQSISIFKKYSYTRVLRGTKWNMYFHEGALTKFEDNVISIDERADAILFDGYIYVLNRYYFESFFSYTDCYHNVLESALDQLETQELIEGFELFKASCVDKNKIAKKFTKIMKEDGLQTFLNNMERIPEIINEYELNITFRDNKLIYEDETNLPEILKLLSNDFVLAALDGRRYESLKKKPL